MLFGVEPFVLPNLKQKGMHGGPGCCRGHHRSPKKLTPGHASRKSFFFFLMQVLHGLPPLGVHSHNLLDDFPPAPVSGRKMANTVGK